MKKNPAFSYFALSLREMGAKDAATLPYAKNGDALCKKSYEALYEAANRLSADEYDVTTVKREFTRLRDEITAHEESVSADVSGSEDGAAIEIKIGQGTKPGMGGHLPGSKVTPQIAAIRGRKEGEDIQSPSRFPEVRSKDDLKDMVTMLRTRSEGRPIGIKIAAGNIERDLAVCVYAEPDFITIDGRGGATGSSPYFLREATSVPTIYALSRARKFLDNEGVDIDLVITGGLRVSSDFAKAIAMGADAVAVATGALIAAACQQYRICGSGYCPVGIATQNPALRARLRIDDAAKRVANYLMVSSQELKMFARISGVSDIHDLSYQNLITTDRDIAKYTGISHAGEEQSE